MTTADAGAEVAAATPVDSAAPNNASKDQKNKKRRRRATRVTFESPEVDDSANHEAPADGADEAVTIEYTVGPPPTELSALADSSLSDAFARLSGLEPKPSQASLMTAEDMFPVLYPGAGRGGDEEHEDRAPEDSDHPLSARESRKRARPTLPELKLVAPRPAVVDASDVSAPDPELLVFLKSRRSAVPVPRHWPNRHKYLSGKRASDKVPYQLPDYIQNTGIAKLREAHDETEDSLKARMREKVRPKLGKLDIDYSLLHDAFFKYQTAPVWSRFGDLYYEGKEKESTFSQVTPGVLSAELLRALDMSDAPTTPPPWLGNMQRFGPPPSYPNVAYPGVNAPLPPGAQYGNAPGQWGRPPTDAAGKPLYGNVFGQAEGGPASALSSSIAGRGKLWGETLRSDDVDDALSSDSYEDDREDEVELDREEAPEEEILYEPKASAHAAPLSNAPIDRNAASAILPTQAHRVVETQKTSMAGTREILISANTYNLKEPSSEEASSAPAKPPVAPAPAPTKKRKLREVFS